MIAFLLYSKLALRNVLRNRRRTLFTVTAISFGLFCLIVFQALKVGLHREMTDGTVLLETGSIQIHAAGYESNLASLKPIPEPHYVEAALRAAGIWKFSRRLRATALVLSEGGSSTVFVTGVDPVTEPSVTRVATKMIAGQFLNSQEKIVIGLDLAKSLRIMPGQKLTLLTQSRSGRPVIRTFEVGGIYKTELSSFNRTRIFMTLPAIQSFVRAEGTVTEISAATDRFSEVELAGHLKQALSNRYQVRTWREVAPDLSQLIDMNDATMRLLIVIVFSIVALGIVNTMTMTVFERYRELGVMAAIGTSPQGIMAIVTLESVFIGISAALFGSLAGVAACGWLAGHGIDMSHFTSSNQYFAMTHVIRAFLLPGDLLAANAVALLTALIAGLYPAFKAARLAPVQAITHT